MEHEHAQRFASVKNPLFLVHFTCVRIHRSPISIGKLGSLHDSSTSLSSWRSQILSQRHWWTSQCCEFLWGRSNCHTKRIFRLLIRFKPDDFCWRNKRNKLVGRTCVFSYTNTRQLPVYVDSSYWRGWQILSQDWELIRFESSLTKLQTALWRNIWRLLAWWI